MPDTQVLIVGAGPTGLVLALWLTRRGVRVRIVDQAAEAGTTSRALAVQARTLEFYRQLGLAEAMVAAGVKFSAANLWVRGRKVARASFGDMGRGLSPYPYVLIFPQDAHERLLVEQLRKEGVTIERRTALLNLAEGPPLRARLKRADGGEEVCEADYLAGCDGAHSQVRRSLGIHFPGGTYRKLFYVADAQGSGPIMNQELHGAFDDIDFLMAFPMHGGGHVRLVGVAETLEGQREALTWNDVSTRLLQRLGASIEQVNWFSTYHVHHRVAERFRLGHVFLLGDAAHIHSPVGGQGMNTGIGDAVNLAWKLAAVLQGRAPERLLDSYEVERITFARRLVATTDRAFSLVTSPGRIARFVRTTLAPRLFPVMARSSNFRRLMFRTVSQTAMRYRASPLSQGHAGRIRGGNRLPWLPTDRATDGGTDNFAPLASLDWQVHLYGGIDTTIAAVCDEWNLALHRFEWSMAARKVGLKPDFLYLIRPDGHIAYIGKYRDPAALRRYLEQHLLRPIRNAGAACPGTAPSRERIA